MADANSPDPKLKEATSFFEAMGKVVTDNRDRLTNDHGVTGTDMGLVELVGLKGAYNRFKEECAFQLSAGLDCTTVFNTTGGKRLDVNVSMQNGVKVDITSPDGANKRNVIFRPPGKSAAAPGAQ